MPSPPVTSTPRPAAPPPAVAGTSCPQSPQRRAAQQSVSPAQARCFQGPDSCSNFATGLVVPISLPVDSQPSFASWPSARMAGSPRPHPSGQAVNSIGVSTRALSPRDMLQGHQLRGAAPQAAQGVPGIPAALSPYSRALRSQSPQGSPTSVPNAKLPVTSLPSAASSLGDLGRPRPALRSQNSPAHERMSPRKRLAARPGNIEDAASSSRGGLPCPRHTDLSDSMGEASSTAATDVPPLLTPRMPPFRPPPCGWKATPAQGDASPRAAVSVARLPGHPLATRPGSPRTQSPTARVIAYPGGLRDAPSPLRRTAAYPDAREASPFFAPGLSRFGNFGGVHLSTFKFHRRPSPSPSTVSHPTPRVAAQSDEVVEWEIKLDNPYGKELGIDGHVINGKVLLITSLGIARGGTAGNSGGLLNSWNVAQPTRAVHPGDFIVEVNGCRGDAQHMLDEIKVSKSLSCIIARPRVPAGPSSGSYGLTGSSVALSPATAAALGIDPHIDLSANAGSGESRHPSPPTRAPSESDKADADRDQSTARGLDGGTRRTSPRRCFLI